MADTPAPGENHLYANLMELNDDPRLDATPPEIAAFLEDHADLLAPWPGPMFPEHDTGG